MTNVQHRFGRAWRERLTVLRPTRPAASPANPPLAFRAVERVLALFVAGLTDGAFVVTERHGNGPGEAYTDGRTIFLPEQIDRYPDRAGNLRLYKALIAHAAAQVFYGTLAHGGGIDRLRAAPEPDLALELFGIVEGARLTARLGADFPGIERDLARLQQVRDQINTIEKQRLKRLRQAPEEGPHPMILLLAKVLGVGIETADMLVNEALWRNLRDERAIGRYAGITGSPDESGSKRREKGLARAGNARVRRGMVQLAWRWLMFQKESALTKWFRARTAGGPRDVRKTMIVALARKLLIALWRYVTNGEVPAGAKLRPAL